MPNSLSIMAQPPSVVAMVNTMQRWGAGFMASRTVQLSTSTQTCEGVMDMPGTLIRF